MARFRFRLSRVLRIREIEEEVARAQWRSLAAEAAAAEAAADELRSCRLSARAEIARDLESGSTTPAGVLASHEVIDALTKKLVRGVERAKTLRYQADEARPPWEAKRNEVRGLGRLKTKHKEAFRREELLREAKEMDEVASTRSVRKRTRNDQR